MRGALAPRPVGAAEHPVPIRVGDEVLLLRGGQGQDGFGWEEHRCLLDRFDEPIVGLSRPVNIGSDCVS
jgi:hypothetical protein